MTFPLVATAFFLAITLALALLWALVRWPWKRPGWGYVRIVLGIHLLLAPFHMFVTFPLAAGWVGSRLIDTRPDERGYEGPRLDASGGWLVQDSETLDAEAEGGRTVDEEVVRRARDRAVYVEGEGGVRLRAFLVPAERDPPLAQVVLVHGLFRGAMELEPVAAMFRRLGCDVLLLEMRNHGGSDRAPATFGLREAGDVVAAARWLRDRPGRRDVPLVLYGVSLGTAAVALAAPRLPDLAGLVLDAPMDDLLATAHRMLGRTRNEGRRVNAVREPWRSLVLRAVEWWSGFDMAAVRPAAVLPDLPPDLPVLLIGGGEDDRMPPRIVRSLYRSLPMQEGVKRLWIRKGSRHGKVWGDDPEGYEERLGELLQRLRS